MKVLINNKIYIVKFAYSDTFDKASNTMQKVTLCYIKNKAADVTIKNEFKYLIGGKSSCDSRDLFNKAKGRAIAFKRALQLLFSSESIRLINDLTHKDFQTFMCEFKKQCPKSVEFLN